MLVKQGNGQPIREDGPKSHLHLKKGTPSMGGLLILSSFLISAEISLSGIQQCARTIETSDFRSHRHRDFRH